MKSLFLAAAGLALCGTAAFAQATQNAGRIGQMSGACGQPLALTYTLAMPVDQVPAAPLAGTLPRGEPFYLEFTLGAASRVALQTATDDGATDPLLTLFDRQGNVLASDDDSVGDLNAFLDTTLEPGSYCAQVRPVGTGAEGEQAVSLMLGTGAAAEQMASQIVVPPGPADLCTDPAFTADLDRTLAPGVGTFSLPANVELQGRRDWRLTVAQAMDLQIDARSGAFDTTIMLVDEAGNVVAENDDAFGSNTDSRIVLAAQPGSYCLSLSGYDGTGGPAEIVVSDTPEAPIAGPIEQACTDPRNTADLGATLAPGLGTHFVSGMLLPGSRSDWRFEVTGEVLLQFDARSDEFDTMLSLVDGTGQVLEQNDDEPDSVNSRITRTLGPGTYCLAVESFGGAGGSFDLSATDTPTADTGSGTTVDAGFCAAPESTAPLGTDLAPGFGSIALSATLAGALHQDFAFAVAGGTTARFEARSADFDTVLRLAGADGTVLFENDDGPSGSTDSSFDAMLEPGQYCLRLESFGGTEGAAELTLIERDAAALAAEAIELGQVIPAPGSGIEIEDLGALSDRLETSRLSEDLTKWIAFSVGADTGVRIDAVSLGGPFMLRVFTEAGEMVNEAYGGGGITPARLEQPLPAGRYLLAVALEPHASSRLRNVAITRTAP